MPDFEPDLPQVNEGLLSEEELKELEKRRPIFFGRDLSNIPCFKNSFTYGILSGFGTGLITFMSSSRGRLSSDIGVVTFGAVTVGYWCYCRYNWSVMKFNETKKREVMRRFEEEIRGTEKEAEFRRKMLEFEKAPTRRVLQYRTDLFNKGDSKSDS